MKSVTLEWLCINPGMCRYVYAYVCVYMYTYSLCALPLFLPQQYYVQPTRKLLTSSFPNLKWEANPVFCC